MWHLPITLKTLMLVCILIEYTRKVQASNESLRRTRRIPTEYAKIVCVPTPDLLPKPLLTSTTLPVHKYKTYTDNCNPVAIVSKYICFDPLSSVLMAVYSSLTAMNLVYDPQGLALICKTCQYALAVSKSQVTSHLWEKHRIRLESRRDITPLIRSLDIPNPINIRCRPNGLLAHPHLK